MWDANSTQVTAGASSGAVVGFDSEAYDTDTIHDTSTNNSRLTVPSGVTRVKLKAKVQAKVTSGTDIQIYFYKNGSNAFAGNATSSNVGSTAYDYFPIETPTITVAATDYFEIYVYSDDDVLTVNHASSGYSTWFAMEIIE